MKNTEFIVRSLDSEGFFLKLNYKDAAPEFENGVKKCSKYATEEQANQAIEAVRENGFTHKLEVAKLITHYEVVGLEE